MKKPLAVTIGDPAGVGPEILLKAYCRAALEAPFIAVGDLCALEAGMRSIGRAVDVRILRDVSEMVPGALNLLSMGALEPEELIPGKISARCGAAAYRYIEAATHLALEGKVAGIVTLPINKEAVQLTHPGFTGHTEMIADICGAQDVVMMLSSEKLTVTHATTHVSMLEAVTTLSAQRVLGVIRHTSQALPQGARIAVAGLNAHAGEGGLFGSEEIDHIAPAIDSARREGIDATGPYPPDTVFLRAMRGEFDAVVCMYHDQGHIPLKLLDFEGGVNVTLGLPILRTSVDHGTAFDIVMQNKADDRSFVMAFDMAARMSGDR